MTIVDDPQTAFIEAASVPLDAHASGTLEQAEAIRSAHPEVATADIFAAAVCGHADAVARFLALDSTRATTKGGPRAWDPLTYLCFSKYFRIDTRRSEGFVLAARLLLDHGASANTGFHWHEDRAKPEWESVIYAAAGIAHNPELTRLLLERGADPNDGETPYHTPETYDNSALRVLVESGKVNEDSLATLLLRKADWHDHDGIAFLLASGADPNRMTQWHHTALQHAVRRDNALENIMLFLDHGADSRLGNRRDGKSAMAMAARRGRADVLTLIERRGTPLELHGVERLIAACAANDPVRIRSIVKAETGLVPELIAEGGTILAEFAGNGNTEGIRNLLDLGIDVSAVYKEGDGYFGVARDSIALHVAAWRARHQTVKLLLERGSPVDVTDSRGRTPLALAVLACVDSYWTDRRSPESVKVLLAAGASTTGVRFPSGYAKVDDLLRPRS